MSVIPTTSGNPTTIGKTGEKAERKSNDALGKDDFLKLMITQLQWQDPLSPMDDKESIAQLAQFTSLEQMTNMTNSMAGMQATTMIGKTVTWSNDAGQELHGVVKQVNIVSGKPQLIMNDNEISFKKLTSHEPYKTVTDLVGTQVSYYDSNGQIVSGSVTAIKLLNGKKITDELTPDDVNLIIAGDKVDLDKVSSIKNTTA